nr:DUF3465 domain-containing protein [Salinicola sp. S1-1-2]
MQIANRWRWAWLAALVVPMLIALLGRPLLAPLDGVETAEQRLQTAFETRQEGFWVEASAQVVQLLPDDREGSRHQRLIVALDSGQTLLIAHNIDLAPRVPELSRGDEIRFRGEYVWNARGGVIHWTHHDPDGRYPGGWLSFQGRRYR